MTRPPTDDSGSPPPRRGLPARLTAPVTMSFGASALIQVLNLATGIVIARSLGPTGRGELTAVILWPTILATVSSLGVVEALWYHAARRSSPVSALFGSSLVIAALQTAGAVLFGALLFPLVLSEHSQETLNAAYLFLAFIPLNLVALYAMGILNGLQRFGAFNALRLAVMVLSAGAIIGLELAGELDVTRAAVGYLAANAVTLAIALALVYRVAGRPTVSRSTARDLLGFGLRSHVSTVSSLLNERLDQLVVSAFLSSRQLGYYVVAYATTSLTSLVGNSVALVALPRIAALESAAERLAMARRYIALTLIGSVVTIVPLLAFTPTAIRLVFGADFLPAVTVTRILLVATVAFGLTRVLGSVLKAVNRPLDAGNGELIGLGVTLVGIAALLPALGITGAGIASLVAYGASALWMTVRAARRLGVSPAALLGATTRQ